MAENIGKDNQDSGLNCDAQLINGDDPDYNASPGGPSGPLREKAAPTARSLRRLFDEKPGGADHLCW